MNYLQHLKIAWAYSYKLLLMSVVAFIHGILPFTFKTYVTDKLKGLAEKEKTTYPKFVEKHYNDLDKEFDEAPFGD